MTKKYLVMPGTVISANDGQRHYIGASVLMRLYRVDPRECVVDLPGRRYGLSLGNLVKLAPRYDGDYTL